MAIALEIIAQSGDRVVLTIEDGGAVPVEPGSLVKFLGLGVGGIHGQAHGDDLLVTLPDGQQVDLLGYAGPGENGTPGAIVSDDETLQVSVLDLGVQPEAGTAPDGDSVPEGGSSQAFNVRPFTVPNSFGMEDGARFIIAAESDVAFLDEEVDEDEDEDAAEFAGVLLAGLPQVADQPAAGLGVAAPPAPDVVPPAGQPAPAPQGNPPQPVPGAPGMAPPPPGGPAPLVRAAQPAQPDVAKNQDGDGNTDSVTIKDGRPSAPAGPTIVTGVEFFKLGDVSPTPILPTITYVSSPTIPPTPVKFETQQIIMTTDWILKPDGLQHLTYKVVGSHRDDTLYSPGSGDGTIEGRGGNDTIKGGDGKDTVVFSGKYSDYTITYDEGTDTFTIKDNRDNSPDGTDTVTGVEFFQFGVEKPIPAEEVAAELGKPKDADDPVIKNLGHGGGGMPVSNGSWSDWVPEDEDEASPAGGPGVAWDEPSSMPDSLPVEESPTSLDPRDLMSDPTADAKLLAALAGLAGEPSAGDEGMSLNWAPPMFESSPVSKAVTIKASDGDAFDDVDIDGNVPPGGWGLEDGDALLALDSATVESLSASMPGNLPAAGSTTFLDLRDLLVDPTVDDELQAVFDALGGETPDGEAGSASQSWTPPVAENSPSHHDAVPLDISHGRHEPDDLIIEA